MPSLRCLISTLTQAGGGALLFRFASSVQSCCGEGGRCRQTSLCVGSTRRVPATLGLPRTGVSVLSPSALLRLPAALYGAGPALHAVPVFASSTAARIRLRLRFVPFRASVVQAARGLGALPSGAPRPLPPQPQRAPPVGSQEVFRQDPGPVCRVGGGGFSGAEFAPFPSPCLLTPAGMGRLFSGVSQSLCFANRRRCVPAGEFFLAPPQFKKSSPRLLSGPSGWSLP